MFYHLSLVAAPNNMVMWTNDTDSQVIAMECKQFCDTSLKLWLEFGTQPKLQSDILVLVGHVKNLVHHNAMRNELFMPLHVATIQRHLKGKTKSQLLNCQNRALKQGSYLLKCVVRFCLTAASLKSVSGEEPMLVIWKEKIRFDR